MAIFCAALRCGLINFDYSEYRALWPTELEYMALEELNVAVLRFQGEENLDTDSQVVYGPSPGIHDLSVQRTPVAIPVCTHSSTLGLRFHDLIKKKRPMGTQDRAKRKRSRLEKF